MKEKIDQKVAKLLTSSIAITFLLYLAGSNINFSTPLWGLQFSQVPGAVTMLSLASAYALAMATYSFMNSQIYAALIDQVVLLKTDNGATDPDLVKSGHQEEWLIFKTLRANFSFYFPVHIEMSRTGKIMNGAVFFLLSLIAVFPFIAMIFIHPYLTLTLVSSDLVGLVAKFFSCLCSFSAVCLVVISMWEFECTVELASGQAPKE